MLLTGYAMAVQAQVQITGPNFQFGSFSPQLKEEHDSVPARQISYKLYTFAVGTEMNVNDFRPHSMQAAFGQRLQGQRGIGRLLLLSTCNSDCGKMSHSVSQTIFVNVSADTSDNDWKQAANVDRFGLTLLPSMFQNPRLEFAVNGSVVRGTGAEMRIGNSGISHYYIQVFERNDPCRKYKAVYGVDSLRADDDPDFVSIDLPWSRRLPQTANGIVVGAPKVYDTYALAALRNDALQKIKLINPFLAGSLTSAYGNVQGVSRDQSYVNVQAQGGAAQTIAPVTSITDSTATCPAGYYPYGSSACAPITSGTSSTPLTAVSSSQTLTPSSTGLVASIPAAPASNPLSAAGPVGQSSADVLVEQVQLSGQLQVYQLLLEGAQSDALFVQNARAIANRAQTTVSFPISIDPPRQFRHAVAEVRVLIEPFPSAESGQTQPVSIVNLLPSQKTYNVAKITSKQHAFGGAAVIEQVASVGVSTGKSKDRLYLAKDTDTVALQYDHPSVKPLRSPFPDRAMTGLEAAVHMQRLDECDNEWFAIDDPESRKDLDSSTSRDNSVLFGWQFRPVLGADYVAGGPRQVFAQLALPEALEEATFLPAVLVQTRWREYDEKRQVVGPVFHSSCTVTSIKDPVIIENPLRVNDTTWDDVGNGVIKIRAHGTFLSPSIQMQSGRKTYPPVTFDGHDIQFFAPAKDLLGNGEINLLAENNKATSLTIPLVPAHAGCNIESSALWAIPRADGTAEVMLTLWPGSNFKTELKGSRPLVMIGSDVYGLKEKPFQKAKVCDSKGEQVCVYQFSAAADSLRAASNYYVRDISWSNSNLPGPIHFAPLLSGLAKYYDDTPAAPTKTAAQKAKSATYMVAGSDLKLLLDEKPLKLRAYSVDSPQGVTLTSSSFAVVSDSEALVTLPQAPKGKTITIAWTPSHWPLSRDAPIVWDLTVPVKDQPPTVTPTPSFLYAGDSRTVTYSGVDFSNVKSIRFEGLAGLAFKISPDDPKSMDVVIPTYITKEAGHKELVAATKDPKGKTDQLILPIEIFRH